MTHNVTSESAADTIQRTEQEMQKACHSRDAAQIANFFATDGVMAIIGEEAIRGRDQIAKRFADFTKDPAFSMTFSSSLRYIAESGEIGYATGQYSATYTDPATSHTVTQKGNYLAIYIMEAGRWMLSQDFSVPSTSIA